MTTRVPVGVFFALFTISGFAGLIYESIWSHYLKLFLGHAAYAQTLVLAIFMGGMALGSWLVSRYTQRIANLLLSYAIAELGIGVLAIVFHRVFVSATGWAFETVLPALGSGGVDLFKWGLASILILPASVLLGTTFPLMSAGIIRLYPEASGRALSMLYFTNSFGAALGVLASGFYLIDRFGLPGTILTAGLLNVALALIVVAIAWPIGARPAAAATTARPEEGDRATRKVARAILLLAFATGAASFIYEITWIRMLTLGLGASTHAFEVMLAAFILGMSLGAFWIRNRIGRLSNDIAWLAVLLLAKAVFAVLALWAYGEVLEFIRWVMQGAARSDAGYGLVTLAGLAASLAVMLPTAFCAGITLPLATHALISRGHGEASIGRVYGANTAGCILGAIFAIHVGMEAFGVKGLTGIGALLDVAAALLVLVAASAFAGRRWAAAAFAVVLVAATGIFAAAQLDQLRMASGIFRYAEFVSPGSGRVSFYRDGKTSTVSVVDIGGVATIRTNGKPDAGLELDPARRASEDEATLLLLAALPLAMKPDAAVVANIGFGSGLTTHALLGSPRVREMDSIEIERMIVEGARVFDPRNRRAYTDPRSRIHIEDAKTFFSSTAKRYDIIVSEPSNPWVSGVSTLFSEEFYGQLKGRLKPDGVMVQWVHAYELDLDLLSSIFKALGKHFSDYAVYAWNPGDLYVVATPQGKLPALGDTIFSFPLVVDDLARLGIVGVNDLNTLRVGGRRVLEPLFEQAALPANSDYFPLLDQRAPRARFRKDNVFQLRAMREALEPTLAMLDEDNRTTRSRLSGAGKMQPPRVARAAAGLEAVDIFVGAEPQGARTLSHAARINAVAAHSLLAGCKSAQGEFLQAVTEIVTSSAPYLAGDEVDAVFNRIRQSPCWNDLDDVGKRRIALLRAINRRDAQGMADHSAFLLRNAKAPSEQEFSHYLASGLTALMALQKYELARSVTGRFVPGLSERERQRLLIRLVEANVKARAAEGSTR